MYRRRRVGVNWYAWSCVWWGSLALAAITPSVLAHLVRLRMGNPVAYDTSMRLLPNSNGHVRLRNNLVPAMQAKLATGIRNIDAAAEQALTFDANHPVHIPSKVGVPSCRLT